MSKFLSLVKITAIWLVCFTIYVSAPNLAKAQDSEGGDIYDVDENFRPDLDAELSTGLASFDAGVAGDTIDMSNGSLTFRHTDVSLPGNSDLPVSFGRFYTYKGVDYHGNQVGGWNMDIPFLQSSYNLGLEHEVHPLLENSGLSADDLFSQELTSTTCSSNLISSNTHPNEGLGGVDPATGLPNSGLRLFMPGQGGELLTDTRRLSTAQVNNVFGSTSPSKVTASNMVARCNDSGTGAEVVSPNGWSYSFGYSVTHITQRVRVNDDYFSQVSGEQPSLPCNMEPLEGGAHTGPTNGCATEAPNFIDQNDYVMLVAHRLTLPTEIRDTSGNWVRYEYDGRRLTRIHANDGREITIEYEGTNYSGVSALYARKRVKRVTANDRDWVYNYSVNETTGISMLESVTRPDELEWLYDVPRQPTFQIGVGNACSFNPTSSNGSAINLSVTHPAGTRADFTLSRIEQGFTKVPDIRRPSSPGETPSSDEICKKYYEAKSSLSYAVKTKTLTIFDHAQNSESVEVWNYDYEQDQGERIDEDSFSPPSGPTSAADLRKTTVTNPEGEKTEYYYDRRFDSPTIGSLMKQKTYNAGELSPLSETEISYDLISQYGSSGLPGSCTSTAETNCTRYNDYAVQYNSPYQVPLLNQKLNKVTTVTQTGDVYTTEKTYDTDFGSADYSYGFPVSDRTYSNQLDSSGPRGRDIEYIHDTSKWILGLPSKLSEVSSSGVIREAVTYTHNAKGLLTNKTRYGQPWVSLTYHDSGNQAGTLATATDALGRTTEALDWHRGKPTQILRADDVTISQAIDDNGWVTSSTDGKGNAISYNHDDMGRLTGITPPTGWDATTIDYDFPEAGGAIQTIEKGGAKTTVTYDSMFRTVLEKTEATDTLWVSYVNTTYDGLGRPIFTSQPSSSDVESKGIETTYDGLGRVIKTRENFGEFAETTTAYLKNHATEVTDPDGNVTTSYKDGYGDLIRIVQPEATTTTITRNNWGQITQVRQEGGHNGFNVNKRQLYEYDDQQRLCRHENPNSVVKLFAYNAAGELRAESSGHDWQGSGCEEPNGTYLVEHEYDALGRLTYTDYAEYGTASIGREYDDNGNLTALYQEHNRDDDIAWYDDMNRVAWTYDYDNANNLTEERLWVDRRNFIQTHKYFSDGSLEHSDRKYQHDNHIAPGYAYTQKVSYTRDGLGRALGADLNGTGGNGSGGFNGALASGTTYHASGAMTAMSYGNGQNFTQTLNARLLPETMTTTGPGGTALDLSYLYNDRGLVSRMDDLVNPENTRVYSYDGQGRLTTATGPWGENGANAPASYSYDSLGNIREKVLGDRSVAMSYDGRNRLSAANDTGETGNRALSYDTRGNVTWLGGQNFTYNAMNRPTSMGGDVDAVYRYDGHGRRIRTVMYKDEGGYIIRYNVFGASGDLIFNVQIDQSPSDEDYVTTMVKMDGQTIARVKSEGRPWNYTDTVTYLHNDHLGSAGSGSKADGTIAWREEYSPFGMTMINDAANDNQAGFTGHIKDSDTGLTYMQARYYDPVIGRFLSVDPVTFLGTGDPRYFNRYAYAANDPVNKIDPDGGQFVDLETGFRIAKMSESGMSDGQISRQLGKESAIGLGAGLGGIGTGLAARAIASRFLFQGIAGAEIAGGAIASEFGAAGLGVGGLTTTAVLNNGSEIVAASKNVAQSTTALGRAFAKHAKGQRATGTFPELAGSNAEINQQAFDIASDILSNPASRNFDEVTGVTTVRNEAGQGVQFAEDTKKLIGFLD